MVNDFLFIDLERKIQTTLNQDASCGGAAVASPEFRANVFYGQLGKFFGDDFNLSDHLNDLSIQTMIFMHSYAQMIGRNLSDFGRKTVNEYSSEVIARQGYAEITDVCEASMSVSNAITHKKHLSGDMACYELTQEELEFRGQKFLDAALRFMRTKVRGLGTTIGDHLATGLSAVEKGKGKDNYEQLARGEVIASEDKSVLIGRPVMPAGYFVGVAHQLGKLTKLPDSVKYPTVFVAERYDISTKFPAGEIAIISGNGGTGSHLSVLIREQYNSGRNIPALMGVGDANDIFNDEIICLDLREQKGKVYRLATPLARLRESGFSISDGYNISDRLKEFYESNQISILGRAMDLLQKLVGPCDLHDGTSITHVDNICSAVIDRYAQNKKGLWITN